MPPSFIMTLAALLGLSALALALVWVRPRRAAETARRVEDLARRQGALEVLLASLATVEVEPARGESEPQPVKSAEPSSSRWPWGPFLSQTTSRRRFDAAESSALSGPTLIAIPKLVSPSTVTGTPASTELARRFGAIWNLAEAGTTVEAIARETGYPIGQVELILGLRRQLTSAGRPRDRT